MYKRHGQFNIAETTNSGAPSTNYVTDYMIYSTYSRNKMLNPTYDWALDFTQTSKYRFGRTVKVDSGILVETEPYILWSDVLNGRALYSWNTTGGFDAEELERYKTTVNVSTSTNPIGDKLEIIALEEKKYSLAEAIHGEQLLIPKNGRQRFRDDPEWKADANVVHYSHVSSEPHRRAAGYTNLVVDKQNDRSYFKPDDYSGIHALKESTTFSVTEGGGSSTSEFATTEREICFARIDSGTNYGKDGRVGLSFNSKWAYHDDRLPVFDNETVTKATANRAISRVMSVPLPGPIQLDSDLTTSPSVSTHTDQYTYGCRTDITFRVMDMPQLPMYHADNLDKSGVSKFGLERCFFILMSQNQMNQVDSPTGHIYDYHQSMQRGHDNDTTDDLGTTSGNGMFGWWIVNFQGQMVAQPMNWPANAYPSSGNDDWNHGISIDKHLDWYDDWDQGGSDAFNNVLLVGSGTTGEAPTNRGTRLPTGEWVTLSIFADPDKKYITYEWLDTKGEKLGGYQFMANGVAANAGSTQSDGQNTNWSNWPAYLNMGIVNTHIDLPATSSVATNEHTETAYVGSTSFTGLDYGMQLDSNIVVHLDSVKCAGGMSDADNCSVRYENRYSNSNIQMKNIEVIASRHFTADGFFGTPHSKTGSLAEVINVPNRHTLVIGHESYKAMLGNCEDGVTTDDDEKCVFWFNGLRKLNSNTPGLTELETDDAGDITIATSSSTNNTTVQNFAIGYSTAYAYNGKQINEDQMTDGNSQGDLNRDSYFITDAGSYQVDDFTKNGAVIADWVDGSGTFTSREHILASAKIVRIISKSEMQVANPHLLKVNNSPGSSEMTFRIFQYNKDPDDATSDGSGNYIDCKILDIDYTTGYVKVDTNLYLAGSFTTTTGNNGGSISSSDDSVILTSVDGLTGVDTGGIVLIGSEYIQYKSIGLETKKLKGLTRGVLSTTAATHTDGATVTPAVAVQNNVIKQDELHTWFISPKAYWLTFHFFLTDDSDNFIEDRAYSSIFGFLSDDSNPDTVVDSLGFSYNEALYTVEAFKNFSWNLASTTENSSLVLDKDYGYGNYENKGDKNKFGYVATVGHSTSGTKYANLDNMVELDKVMPGDDIGLYVEADTTTGGHYEIDIFTTGATNDNIKPQLFCQFFDEVPPTPLLEVGPDEENAYYPKFKWSCEAEDLWYGLLYIDEVPAPNQYHNAILHLPLDNSELNDRTAHGSNPSEIENLAFANNTDTGTTSRTANLSETGVKYDVEGLGGFSLRFDGDNDHVQYNPSSGNTLGQLEHEATWVVHTIPDTIDSDSEDYILGSDPVNIILSRSSDAYSIKAQIYQTSSNYVELQSSTIIVDGETPYSIIVTFDADLTFGNCKLFINGKLVDQTGMTHVINDFDLTAGANPTWPTSSGNRGEDLYESTNAFTLGGDKSSGNHYKGRIEEVVVYPKCLYPVVPSDNEFIFTKPVTEISDSGKEGAPKVYTARLFMKDYHNIRGDTSKQVATSAPVSFKKAGFRLS